MRRTRFVPALIALALAGCRGAGDAPATSTAATGGTLVIATPGDPDNLLPPFAGTQFAAHVTERIFPRLAELTLSLNTVDDSGFTPVIARHWEHRDSTTIVFHLDPRAHWQDGRPITADDVVYTFGVYRDTLSASPFRVLFERIASVTREDSLTVAFRFVRAYPEQLYDATFNLRLLPKHLLDSIPNDRLASSSFARDPAVGGGPFRFVRWESGTEVTVEADTGWFLGRPHLDRIVWRIMPDVTASVSALLAGEADAMEVILQPDEIRRVSQSSDITLVAYPSPFIGGLLFNLRRPPFGDREVRRAIAMTIDRETIVRSVFGTYGEVPGSAVSRMVWISEALVRQIAWDTAAADRLLDSLGWRRGGDGIRRREGRRMAFTVLTPTTSRIRQEVAVHLQSQLQRAGIAMQIQPVDLSVFDQRTRAGNFDAMMFSRTLDPSPTILGQFWTRTAIGGDNLGRYDSPGFDSLYARATAANGKAAALPVWGAALQRLIDDAPAIAIYSPRNNAAIHRRLEHVTIRPDSWLATVASWSVAPDRRLPRDR